MERIINKLIDDAVANVDTYINSGSTWLIFTDDKRWVIELTKDGTLWYNYNFFNGLFGYASMDVIENQHHITKWVENNVINKKKPVKNGVKHTEYGYWEDGDSTVEYTIQNGVKETSFVAYGLGTTVEDIIQNGVKHTEKSLQINGSCVIEDVIREGVKHTEYGDWLDGDERLDDIIDNGIKETHDDAYHHTGRVDGVIKNGVKECIPSHTPLYNPMDFSVQYRENHRLDDVASVLEKGIKKTKVMDEWVNTDRIVDGVISSGVKKSPI